MLENIVGAVLAWAVDKVSSIGSNVSRQINVERTNRQATKGGRPQYENQKIAEAVLQAKEATFASPEQSIELSIRAIKVAINELWKTCGVEAFEVRSLEQYLLDYGMEGWTKFWEEEVSSHCPTFQSFLEHDPWSPVNSVLLRAWLMKLGRGDPRPDSYYTSLADFNPREVWIRADSIALLIDTSMI